MTMPSDTSRIEKLEQLVDYLLKRIADLEKRLPPLQ